MKASDEIRERFPELAESEGIRQAVVFWLAFVLLPILVGLALGLIFGFQNVVCQAVFMIATINIILDLGALAFRALKRFRESYRNR